MYKIEEAIMEIFYLNKTLMLEFEAYLKGGVSY